MGTVYEGRVDLTTAPFKDAIKEIEKIARDGTNAIGSHINRIEGFFNNLSAGINGDVNSMQAAMNQLKGTMQSVSAASQQQTSTQIKGHQQAVASKKRAVQEEIREANLLFQQGEKLRQIEIRTFAANAKAKFDVSREWATRTSGVLKNLNDRELADLKAHLDRQIAELTRFAQVQQRISAHQTKSSVFAKTDRSLALQHQDLDAAREANVAYAQAVTAAKRAERLEIEAQRNITAFKKLARQAEAQAAQEAARIQIAAQEAAANRGRGLWGLISREVRQAGNEIKKTEDQFNSLFRAGSQISSVGQQISILSGLMLALGFQAEQVAEDFDFMARRAVSAAQSAGSALSQDELLSGFKTVALNLAEAVGTTDFAGVAEALYVWQSAAGKAIETEEDFIVVQNALTSTMQAAQITGDNYSNVVRGNLQVLAEFQLGVEDTDRVMQILLNTTQVTQSELPDIFEAFKYVGPLAAEMNISIEQTAAIFGKLSEFGLKGSMAGRGFAQMLEALVSPSKQSATALQELFIDSKGLEGSWRDVLQPGGEFIAMLDQINADGSKTEGVITLIAKALMGMSEAQQADYINKIFAQNNAARVALPLIAEQMRLLNGVSTAADDGKMSLDELYQTFQDGGKQAQLFSRQWEVMEGSIRVQFGRAVGEIKKNLITIGTAVIEVALPILQRISQIVAKFMQWAEANESTARTILKVAAGIALAAAVIGPFLMALGSMMQGLGAIPVIAQTFVSGFGLISRIIMGFIPALMAMSAPMLALAALVAFIALAWANDWAGMRGTVEKFMAFLGKDFLNFFSNLFAFVQALMSGDSEKIKATFEILFGNLLSIIFTLGGLLVESFLALFELIGEHLPEIAEWLYGIISRLFASIFRAAADDLAVWGGNLIAALAQGIINGAAEFIPQAMEYVGNAIGAYLKSFSPPKKGPLTGIFEWGKNLIKTFAEGMSVAELDVVEEAMSRIAGAIKDSFETGEASGNYVDAMKRANELTLQMVATLREGRTVGEDFFSELQPYLGNWYDSIRDILFSYQQVFLVEQNLTKEKERLELLRQQREELRAQLDLRLDAFDSATDRTGPEFYKKFESEMVDPTTEAGQATIERMRQALSTEDFQSWISFQKRLWESKHKAEDRSLKVQEDTAELAVRSLERQLELVEAQYLYFVKMYEFAQKLVDIKDEDPTEPDVPDEPKIGGGGGGGGGGIGLDDEADTADLEEQRRRARAISGEDVALAEETELRGRAGDDLNAIGLADEQADRERERIKDLDAENRKRQSEFDTRKINAKGNEEQLAAIKKEEEAWNAAYREEKARLQERAQYAKEVSDATQEAADATEPARIAEKRVEFAKEISEELGEQTEHIQDANQLKDNAKDLDDAAVAAQKQLKVEEKTLGELRDMNQQKQIEFQERLTAAGDNEEEIRRINEEKAAWDLAYDAAVLAQEERVEQAREALEVINELKAAINEAKGLEGGAGVGGGGGVGGPKIKPEFPGGPPVGGGGGGGFEVPDAPTPDFDFDLDLPDLDGSTEPIGEAAMIAEAERRERERRGREQDAAQEASGPISAGQPAPNLTPEEIARQRGEQTGGAIIGAPGQGRDEIVLGWQTAFEAFRETLSGEEGPGREMMGHIFEAWGQEISEWSGESSNTIEAVLQAINNANAEFTGIPESDRKEMEALAKTLNGLGMAVNQEFVDALTGPGGPVATSNFTLQKVNGVWTSVLRDDPGAPAAQAALVADSIKVNFAKIRDDDSIKIAMDKTKEIFAALGTGETSPPSFVESVMDRVKDKFSELDSTEDGIGKSAGKAISSVSDIFKNMEASGALSVPSGEELGKVAAKFSDFNTKDEPASMTSNVLDRVKAAYNNFETENAPANKSEALLAKVRDIFGAFEAEGKPGAVSTAVLDAVKLAYSSFQTAADTPSATSQTALDAVRTAFFGWATGQGNPAELTGTALGAVIGVIRKNMGTEGVQGAFQGSAAAMLATANSTFGANGPIARAFGEMAGSVAAAAASAAAAAARAATAVPTEGSHFGGIDLIPGGISQPTNRILHGEEAVLDRNDGAVYRAVKRMGLWKTLRGAIINKQNLREAIRSVASPEATKPAEPERTTMPLEPDEKDAVIGTNRGDTTITKTTNINIARIDTRNADEARYLINRVAHYS